MKRNFVFGLVLVALLLNLALGANIYLQRRAHEQQQRQPAGELGAL